MSVVLALRTNQTTLVFTQPSSLVFGRYFMYPKAGVSKPAPGGPLNYRV